MTHSPTAFPDPVLTASIYCERRQDHFLSKAIAPFWREVRSLEAERDSYLWFVRYGRCGEHVKVRLHAPEERRESLAALLAKAVEAYFAEHAPLRAAPRKDWSSLPPIDEQDQAEQDYPDRSLLWTRYQRSHVSLGGKPFLEDDRYVALMTRCIGEGCEIVLSSLVLDATGQTPHTVRQSTLLKLLPSALQSLCPDMGELKEYLAYHRDWLIRFSLVRRNADPLKTAEILKYFDDQVAATEASALTPLRAVVAAQWRPGAEADQPELWGWRSSLSSLRAYVEPLAAQPGYRLDPFAVNPAFAPYFKVLHGMANQVGLNMLNEAFTHHLLLQAATPVVRVPEPASTESRTAGTAQ
ncbi:MAG TPA: lantibiotic dehydratase C-terminal domain-containing protein [Thermoanaerobaculia bacterium]|jgi:hypothetical protein|nr:lantibiotic dehydratase C-terminal domain-containing protein [Thermoanaerobaculia bacterium]